MTEAEENYILAHIDAEPQLMQQITRDTYVHLLNPRMISGHLQGRLLKMLCRMMQPRRVLEVGTFTGYATLCMAEGLPADGHIDTIEHNDELQSVLQKNIQQSSNKDKITIIFGDALQVIQQLQAPYDLIFIDADKRHYREFYELALPLLRQGGIILADNTLWNGKLTQPVTHGDAQTRAIMSFNDFVAIDKRVEKVILPLRDGLTMIWKK